MAFAASKLTDQLLGLAKIHVYSLDFTGATSGDIVTGMTRIHAAFLNNQVSEGQGLVVPNVDTDGTTSKPGAVHVSSVNASDIAQLVVIGF